MTFLLDANVCPRFQYIIKAHDSRHIALILREHFPAETPDVDWICACAQRKPKPYIVGGDKGIFSKQHERQALLGSGLTFIYLDRWQSLSWRDSNWKYLKYWPDVVDILAQLQAPHLLRLKPDGSIRCDPL